MQFNENKDNFNQYDEALKDKILKNRTRLKPLVKETDNSLGKREKKKLINYKLLGNMPSSE